MAQNQNKNQIPTAPNKIWYYRKRIRLGQKQVAYLMGLKSVAHVSHYERGAKIPKLENAIKLEVVLGVPLSFIFDDLASRIRKEVHARREAFNRISKVS